MSYSDSSIGSAGNDSGEEYLRFCKFLRAKSGISLPENKQYLVENRLKNILTDQGLPSVDALLDHLSSPEHKLLADKIIDAMTTNETYWFRDPDFFEYLKHELFPAYISGGLGETINIWSAACSNGQEAYSASMALNECLKNYTHQSAITRCPQFKIIGTDLSSAVIEHACSATYSALEISRGLPASYEKYFELAGKGYRVTKEVSNRTNFKQHNLLDDFSHLGSFDIIICRNSLIYFDEDIVNDILKRMHGALKPGGILFLSASETIKGLKSMYQLEKISCGFCYRAIK